MLENFHNVLVVGLGLSGKSSVKLLGKYGINTYIYDDKLPDEKITGVINRSELTVIDAIADIDHIVVSPGVSLDTPIIIEARKKLIPVISEIELGYYFLDNNIIAVTGTNGKTTTTLLAEKLLKSASVDAVACGNIGLPFTEVALNGSETKVPVIEVSSFQLESCYTFKPMIGILLNISYDHMERHRTFENYVNCKARLFQNMTKKEYGIFNYNDSECRKISKICSASVYYFSISSKVKGAYVKDGKIFFKRNLKAMEEYVCAIEDIRIKGRHNIENALAVICAAKILNFDNYTIKECLKEFTPPRHRIENIARIKGVNYYNDSKGTNIGATLAACRMMEGPTLLIMGGYDKGIGYLEFFKNLPNNIKYIYLVGDNKYLIKKDGLRAGFKNMKCFSDLEECVTEAGETENISNILFSPSTSSFDRYTDYKERGTAFCNLVKNRLI